MILLRVMTVGFTLRNVIRSRSKMPMPGAGRDRLNPQPEVAGEDRKERQANDQHDHQADEDHRAAVERAVGQKRVRIERVHGFA